MSDLIQVSRQGNCVHLVINRPDKKNALTQAMYAELATALLEADADKSVAAVVLTGVADSFTAGNDLHDFLAMDNIDESAPVFQFLQALTRIEVPLVAGVNGLAIGIGTTLLLHCDFVYASRDARFALPFINLGLVPEGGSSLLLPQLIGHQRAAELLLLGDMFSADDAYRFGMLNEIVEADQLESRLSEVSKALGSKPVSGLRAAKRLMKQEPEPVSDRIDREVTVFAKALQSPEARAAIQATVQKSRG